MADIFKVDSNLEDLTVGDPHAITGLIVDIDDENYFIAGDDTGFIVEVTCPYVTGPEQTQQILDLIKEIDFVPYEASQVLIDPSAELGDYFTCPNFSGGIFSRKCDFFGTMDSDLALPYSEEEDHEYTYVPPETRNYKRDLDATKEKFTAEITATAQSIRSDVAATYATQTSLADAVDDLNDAIDQAAGDAYAESVRDSASYLEQNALKISAGVVTSFGMTDGSIVAPSFNWALTARAFKIYTHNEADPEFAFTVDEQGLNPRLTVRGTIKADSGVIGYWTIVNEGSLYNGVPFTGHWADSDDNNGSTGMGPYGTSWAFWAGDGRFRVDQSGNVVCRNIQVENGSVGGGGTGGYAGKSTLFTNDEITYRGGIGGGIAANSVFAGIDTATWMKCTQFQASSTASFYGPVLCHSSFAMFVNGVQHNVSLGSIKDYNGETQYVLKWA